MTKALNCLLLVLLSRLMVICDQIVLNEMKMGFLIP